MTIEDRWLLPDGIEELLPPTAEMLERLRRQLLDLYGTWGYELVVPPFIEFLDSLLIGTGNDLDLQTFKLTDQLSGRLMGVRADMTPQVARIDAHQLRREGPVRLCYGGTVLRTRSDGFAGSRSPVQIGVELYGHRGFESDLEVLGLMLETLNLGGLSRVHLDLGHVAIFRFLAQTAGLDVNQETTLFEALQRKAVPEIEQHLASWDLAAEAADMLGALVHLNGEAGEVLSRAGAALGRAGESIQRSLEWLHQIVAGLTSRYADVELHVDLAELRGYHYHTGVVYAAYVPGHGQAVAQGGRYDDIGRAFGRARPATGFSVDLKTLLALGGIGLQPPAPKGIFAPRSDDPALSALIRVLREQGERVIRELPGQTQSPHQLGCNRRLVAEGENWRVADLGGG
jgi:ATP phosphoribosyltransferase regulatory subunit